MIMSNILLNDTLMSTQTMQHAIADCFKTQPVVKAWLFGSFARESVDRDIILIYERAA